MLVLYPSSLFSRIISVNPSSQWKSRAGWSEPIGFIPVLSRSYSPEEFPDGFIQKGKGEHNACYHAKLPAVKRYVSQSALEYWASQHRVGSGYDLKPLQALSTEMYQSADNGIHNAYIIQPFLTSAESVVWATCTPSRGIKSDFWTIGSITYTEWQVLPNSKPTSRYTTRQRSYSVSVTDHFPWFSRHSYDSSLAEAAIFAHYSTSSFGSWSSQLGARYPEYNFQEYTPITPYTNLFKEDKLISGYPGSNGYELDWLVQHAFYDACQGIGKANDNTIQNIVQIVSDLAGICSSLGMGGLELADDAVKSSKRSLKKRLKKKVQNQDLVKVVDSASSGWLGYRYSVSTSLMDYKQYVQYINHKADTYFDFLDKDFTERVYGHAQRSVDGVAVTCTCHLAYRPRAYEGLKSCLRYIHDAGLEINPYVLWDFIPFSFMVDWAVPLGDVFDVISNQKYYSENYYDFKYVGFSIKYEWDEGTRYYRWYQLPPDLESCYWFDKGGSKPSGKLILKRSLDAASLIVG